MSISFYFGSPPPLLRLLLIPALALGALPLSAKEGEPIPPDDLAFFESKIRPLLAKNCYECHSEKAKKVKGGLLLDSHDGVLKGGDSGDVIESGDPAASLLIKSVRSSDPDHQMPPKKKLTEAEIEALSTWVRIGAPDPRKGGKASLTAAKLNWTLEEGRKHWAYQPLVKTQPPSVTDKSWVKADTDRFLLAKMEEKKLKPAPDADRATLIRRATYDLTGLPPTVEEVQAFVKDAADDDAAFASVVDRLLKSPRFGERWGRHWLDVVRYADSVGRTRNIPFPFAWRYRDYVIDSFNADKPFNRFLTEQLAGDLMPAANEKERDAQVLGTGFLALGSMDLNERDDEQFTLDRIDDQIDTIGRAFMGLTTGCARCHDHKFDPMYQKDYYAVAGILGSTVALSGQKHRSGGKDYVAPNLLVKLGEGKATYAQPASDIKNEEHEKLEKQLDALKAQLAELQKSPQKKNQAMRPKRRELLANIEKASAQLRGEGGEPSGQPPVAPKKGGNKKGDDVELSPTDKYAMGAREGKIQDLQLRVRGEPDQHGDTIPRGFIEVLQWNKQPAELPKDASGRREFAAWLTDAQHPLTARVAVNRIWQHLFGRGIVPTVDNFGVTGEAPTHPELLDHLAAKFTADGWSVKKMIRSLMLSHAYRISSHEIPANMEADSGNNLFWRMNLRRMEVESIRDSMLSVSGTLNLERPAGPALSPDAGKEIGKGGKSGVGNEAFSSPIRSVYLPVLRSRLPGMFSTFDFAEPSQVIGQRDVTTVPPQALFFLNNEFVVQLARQTSERIAAMPLADDTARVQHAYRLLFSREATADETKRAVDYLSLKVTPNAPMKNERNAVRVSTWTTFVQALLASAEFRYVM